MNLLDCQFVMMQTQTLGQTLYTVAQQPAPQVSQGTLNDGIYTLSQRVIIVCG